jgi:hypothetical protein
MANPNSLIPLKITQLQEDPAPSSTAWMVYVRDGVTYKVQVNAVLNVSGVPTTRQVNAGTGLTGGGDLSVNRTISVAVGGIGSTQLDNTGVTPGVYGSLSALPILTVDANGRITAATTTPFSVVTSITGSAPISATSGATPTISISQASTSTDGYLSSTDWNAFNSKGGGSVTSVDMTVPSFLSVSGNPITTSGTLAVTLSGTPLPVLNGGTGVTTSTGTGSVVLSDSPTLTGTVLIGSPSGTSAVTLGRSSGTSTVNVGTGSTSLIATRTVNIATNGSGTDIVNIGRITTSDGDTTINIGTQVRSSNQTYVNINTGAIGGNAYTTIGSDDGGSLTQINGPFYVSGDSNYQVLLGSTASTGDIIVGQSTVSQTTNIQAGATASGSTKTINIGTGGLAGSTTAITVGSTTGTSVTANGTWTYSTPLAATNMVQATTSTSGFLSSTDWNTFNSKGSGSVTSVSGTGTVSGISLSGTVTSSGSLTLGGALDLSSPPTIGNTTPNTGAFTAVTTPSVTATTTDLTLSAISTGVVNVNTLNGTGLRVTELSGGAVNTGLGIYSGTASQNTVYATPYGTFANSNILLASKGNGNLILGTGSNNGSVANEQMRVSHTASAVNYVQVTGNSTGNAPSITTQGSDAASALVISSKGAGNISFWSYGSANRQFVINGANASVNYHQVAGSLATQAPIYSVGGTDTNISMAFQPKGTGAINLAAGSSGVNISNGGTVTAITRTNTGSGYTTIPAVAITAPTTAGGVQATASANMFVFAVTVANGGTGYTVGNILTLVGGTGAAGQVTVATVSGGVITGITNGPSNGLYSALPTTPAAVTGGTGSGATINITGYGVSNFTITNAGSGYIEQPTVTFSGGGGSGAAAYATVGSGTTLRSLGSTLSLNTTGGEQVRILDNGQSTVNYIQLFGASAGGGPQIQFTGSDASVVGVFNAKGPSGAYLFATNNTGQFRVQHTASAVNYLQVTGAATGGRAIVSAQGSDANIGLSYSAKGTGISVFNNGNGTQLVIQSGATSSVNRLEITPSIAGSAPVLSVGGSDTNIDLSLLTKGTGAIKFSTAGGLQAQINDATTAGPYTLLARGSSNTQKITAFGTANLALQSTGGGTISLRTGDETNTQLNIGHTASAVNRLDATGSTTGNAPVLSVSGSDADIDIRLTPKGTGNVRFGAYTGTILTPTGFIEIKDSGGTVRRLLVG